METVVRVPVVRQVEDQIRTMILEEHYAIGQKLPPEIELCHRMDVSRGTVREALTYLQAKGIVELRAGKGAFVADSSKTSDSDAVNWLVENETDLRNAIEVRRAIEPFVAALTAKRASTELKDKLSETHKEFIHCGKLNDSERVADLDEEFHNLIAEGCGNELMEEIVKKLNENIKTFRNNTFQLSQNIRDAVAPHANILKAITEGNSLKAEKEMEKHLTKIAVDLTLNIESIK